MELSRDLSARDRTELLKKISRSLSLDEDQDERIHERAIDKSEKTTLIHEEMNVLPVLVRFFLWFRSKLTGRRESDLYLNSKINKLKRKIRHQSSHITGFETRNLTPQFAEEVYELYSNSIPLRGLFKKLWLDKNISSSFFLGIIESKLEERIEEPTDLVDMDELVEIYGVNGRKEDVNRKLFEYLNSYISNIDKKIFIDLELELRPFYYLKDLVLFPYVQFFQQFGYIPIDGQVGNRVHFKNASAILCMGDLERLYCAVYSVTKLDKRINISKKMVEQLNLINSLEYSDDDESIDTSELLSGVIEVVNTFNKKIPLGDLIQYFKKNPYYRIMFYLPKIDLKEFYRNILHIKMIDKIESIFQDIKERYIQMETHRIFKGKRFAGFQHYREYSSIDYEKLGVSPFSQIRGLELVYNYQACFFKGYIQETIRLLERGILSQNRLIKDSLTQYASAVEDTEEKIKIFDESLSPDSEDGKLFNMYRFSMSKDPIQEKMYRKIVLHKDREAKSLSEIGVESISGIKRVFVEILKSDNMSIIEQLNQHFFINNKPTLLKDILNEQITHIHQFEHLYHHIIIA